MIEPLEPGAHRHRWGLESAKVLAATGLAVISLALAATLSGCSTFHTRTSAPRFPSTGASPSVSPSASPSRRHQTTVTSVNAYPTPSVDCNVVKCLALTFDDGPGPQTSGPLLDELEKLGVHATFFTIGSKISAAPGVLPRAHDDGDVLGDHTWDHPDLAKQTPAHVTSELTMARDAIASDTGALSYLIRPPYGAWDDTVRTVAHDMGAAIILWNVDSHDWQTRDTARTVSSVLAQAKGGSIVLMHDTYPSTVAAVPIIVDQLRAQGYTLVTVPELLGGHPQPGWVYYSQHDMIHPDSTQQVSQ